VCRQCGKVVEVPDSEFAGIADQLSAGYGFEIDLRHFAILGRCEQCRSRRADGRRRVRVAPGRSR
jgi:Fur family ferric uptake transcriptional regulator